MHLSIGDQENEGDEDANGTTSALPPSLPTGFYAEMEGKIGESANSPRTRPRPPTNAHQTVAINLAYDDYDALFPFFLFLSRFLAGCLFPFLVRIRAAIFFSASHQSPIGGRSF